MTDKVIFRGRVPFEELPAYTACADIGINLLENWGLNYYYSLPNRISLIELRGPAMVQRNAAYDRSKTFRIRLPTGEDEIRTL